MQSEQHVTTDDDVRLSVRIKGTGDQIVIVPNAVYMENVFDSMLAGRTFVFFDLRNRGRSQRIAERDKLTRGIERDVDDLDAVRRHLHIDQAALIGHSYPAFITALYAMRHPEQVRRLALISPMQPNLATQYPPQLTNTDAVAREVFAALGQLQVQAPADPVERCKRAWQILRPLYVANPEHAERLAEWGFCELENERDMLRHLNEFTLPSIKSLALTTSAYARASMPALILHGDKDRSAPYGGGKEWAMRLPDARLLGVENVGHVPWIEATEATFAALDTFLNGQWPPTATTVKSLEG